MDGIFKFKGSSRPASTTSASATPETGDKFDSNGGYVQAGVMLKSPARGRPRSATATREVNDNIATTTSSRSASALSYYYRRHTLKFQMDFGQVETGLGATAGDTRKDHELRMQAQFIF